MPEPLVCEDTSLTRLIETVHRTPGARILYQDTVRRGGVLGFFAREVHRVAYLPGDEPTEGGSDTVDAECREADLADSPIAGLLAAAEEAEAILRSSEAGATPATEATPAAGATPVTEARPVTEATLDTESGRPDFASVLRRHLAESNSAEEAVPAAEPEIHRPAAAEVRPAPPIAEVTPLGSRGRGTRNRLELLMQLRQVGVPISLNPAGNPQSPYEALEDILGQLPQPARLPHRAGQLIVLAGDGPAALRAARTVSRMQRLPLRSIVTAGLDTGVGGSPRRISSPEQAAQLRTELADAATPSVVVVATDGAGLGPDDSWPAEMITALRPDAVWAVIDARWKVEDSQAQLARLPQADALVVHSAQLSASPASVWELGLPIGLLDDQRPYSFVWLGMLMRLLGGSSRHQASA